MTAGFIGSLSMRMALTLVVTFLSAATSSSFASEPKIVLKHLKGGVYLVEDFYYVKENSAVYVGPETVTVIGATWTPESAEHLAAEIRKVTSKPIGEVIVPDYHTDRSGGSAYFRSIGARVVSTRMTYDTLLREWDDNLAETRKAHPGYPMVPLTLPDRTYAGGYELQGGRVRAIYLGPAHTPDGVFVYFPKEKILFGNCILKEFLGYLGSADVVEYPKTLQKLKDLNLGFTTIIAGHGSPLHGPDLIDKFLQMLDEYSRQQRN